MVAATHLKSLQALEMAIRSGSLAGAAKQLGITPAAVGQRIRALEDYLGMDLLVRGRSGLKPISGIGPALDELRVGFAALERACEMLDFQRVEEIHIVADPDWTALWLEPRLPAFRAGNPNILFCINGVGDVPRRLGAPDVRVSLGDGEGEPLFRDILLPLSGPDNLRRIAGKDAATQMDGMPLLHLKAGSNGPIYPEWVEWFRKFGHREIGPDRGVRYRQMEQALEAVRMNVGFVVCGLSLAQHDLEAGRVLNPFPLDQHLVAPFPYRLRMRGDYDKRLQLLRFAEWLRAEAAETRRHIERIAPERL